MDTGVVRLLLLLLLLPFFFCSKKKEGKEFELSKAAWILQDYKVLPSHLLAHLLSLSATAIFWAWNVVHDLS